MLGGEFPAYFFLRKKLREVDAVKFPCRLALTVPLASDVLPRSLAWGSPRTSGLKERLSSDSRRRESPGCIGHVLGVEGTNSPRSLCGDRLEERLSSGTCCGEGMSLGSRVTPIFLQKVPDAMQSHR